MIQLKESAWTAGQTEDRWKDGQTLFYGTLLATAGGPKTVTIRKIKIHILSVHLLQTDLKDFV